MHKIRRFLAATMIGPAAVIAGVALLPASALAQYIGWGAPPQPAPLRPGEVQTPASVLARELRTLAHSPREFTALITAGRAALELGDTQTAIGFFGRAEEVRPSDPAPKIGMGAATVVTGDASGALRWFFEAQRLGATSVALGADRGLAQDLLGNQASAQVDYRAALAGREADEARRRLALSLGISGDRTGAFAALQPLIARRDPAVQRIRAFVLALVGDERGASGAIDQAMPGSGSRMAGFFRLLPSLSAPQKAAAVHLGVFPNPSEIRVAAVSPKIIAASPARREPRSVARALQPAPEVMPPAPKSASSPAPRIVVVDPVPRAATSAFDFQRSAPRPQRTPPSVQAVPSSLPPSVSDPIAPAPQPSITVAEGNVTGPPLDPPVAAPVDGNAPAAKVTATPLPTAASSPGDVAIEVEAVGNTSDPAPSIVALSRDRLSGIDRLLAQADELPVPPAPRPRVEKPKLATDTAKTKKTPDLKKVSEVKKSTDAKKADDAKKAADAKADRDAIGLAGTNWIQLAGGSNKDRMDVEFRRLAAKSAALKKRGGAVTAGKDYFRLLTGPFATRDAAQVFVNQLAKDGVDGFSWTRTPATLKIEKLPPK